MACSRDISFCEHLTYKMSLDILYAIKFEIASLGRKIVNTLVYGIRPANEEKEIRELQVYHDVFKRLSRSLYLKGSCCLKCDQIQKILEAAKKIIGNDCFGAFKKSLDVQRGDRTAWSIKNPTCISYEDWEECMYGIAKKIEFNLTRVDVKDACDLTFSLIKKEISCKLFFDISKMSDDCKIKYTILASENDCKLRYTGRLDKKECQISYKSLLKENVSCALKFHDYVNIINCGVSPGLIRSIYSCGLSAGFSRSGSCPTIVTGSQEFDFSSFSVENEAQLWQRLNDLNIL